MSIKINRELNEVYNVLLKIIWSVYEYEEQDKILSCVFDNSLEILDSGELNDVNLARLVQYVVLLENYCNNKRKDLEYLITKYTKKLLNLTKAIVQKKKLEIKIKFPSALALFHKSPHKSVKKRTKK
jgi:hypothetical protein